MHTRRKPWESSVAPNVTLCTREESLDRIRRNAQPILVGACKLPLLVDNRPVDVVGGVVQPSVALGRISEDLCRPAHRQQETTTKYFLVSTEPLLAACHAPSSFWPLDGRCF